MCQMQLPVLTAQCSHNVNATNTCKCKRPAIVRDAHAVNFWIGDFVLPKTQIGKVLCSATGVWLSTARRFWFYYLVSDAALPSTRARHRTFAYKMFSFYWRKISIRGKKYFQKMSFRGMLVTTGTKKKIGKWKCWWISGMPAKSSQLKVLYLWIIKWGFAITWCHRRVFRKPEIWHFTCTTLSLSVGIRRALFRVICAACSMLDRDDNTLWSKY